MGGKSGDWTPGTELSPARCSIGSPVPSLVCGCTSTIGLPVSGSGRTRDTLSALQMLRLSLHTVIMFLDSQARVDD